MKRNQLRAVIGISLLTLLSTGCGKDDDDSNETFCYTCKIKMKQVSPSWPELNQEETYTMENCGTLREIQAYEKTGTYSTTEGNGNQSVTISSETTCSR